MSVLGKFFGKKTDKPPSLSQAIQNLKETEDHLLKKQNYLESKIEKENKYAKTNASKNKKAALQALQRKKRYEKQLQQLDGALSAIENQRQALEGATTNHAVLTSMKNADDALKAAHKFMNVDQVDEMLGSLADQRDAASEIADAISHPVGWNDEEFDEDDLAKELAEMELEEGEIVSLPSVPKGDTDIFEPDSINDKEKDKAKKKIGVLAS